MGKHDDKQGQVLEGLKDIRTELGSLTPSYHEGQVLRRAVISLIDHLGGEELAAKLAEENPNAASGAPSVTGSETDAVMAPGAVSGPGGVASGVPFSGESFAPAGANTGAASPTLTGEGPSTPSLGTGG